MIRAATAAPAAALSRAGVGFSVGAIGDVSVLDLVAGDVEYRDIIGEDSPRGISSSRAGSLSMFNTGATTRGAQ